MNSENKSTDFIRQIVEADIAKNKNDGRVHTRFPPEPNGYLHIGHAKSICLNFGIARQYNGLCNLRFDDTNPATEETEYVEAIMDDVRWLGFQWDGEVKFASDIFETLYEYALKLIGDGKAYVCDLNADEVGQYRGKWNEPGRDSPFRNRSVEENLDLFERMKNGEFPDGAKTLRAKIDMSAANMNLRDPAMYRIRHAHHHRTGDKWCIYPTYDWTHGQTDSIEGITHSICTLEFEQHRPLYDWYVENLGIHHPQQIEFARLNLTNTVMSKRKLLELVKGHFVSGWDDPRMPTIVGLRRRGYTPESIRNFCSRIGVTKANSTTDYAVLEQEIREDLNKTAKRVLGVLDPIRVVIENFAEGETEWRDAANNPEDKEAGTRKIPFERELFIERDDFMENPPKGYFRLSPGGEVRLRYAYVIACKEIVKDPATGDVVELRCTYDPNTAGGKNPEGRKVKGTIHWVAADKAINAEVRLYDVLIADSENDAETPEGLDWKEGLNPNSLTVMKNAKLEPSLAAAEASDRFQFERLGYFCLDKDSTDGELVFNRTVTLKDSWSKQKGK
ncbi:MAG: glutamine--tRNA ligase/YqeY domain fusion protein [Pirellulaceae bacterium]